MSRDATIFEQKMSREIDFNFHLKICSSEVYLRRMCKMAAFNKRLLLKRIILLMILRRRSRKRAETNKKKRFWVRKLYIISFSRTRAQEMSRTFSWSFSCIISSFHEKSSLSVSVHASRCQLVRPPFYKEISILVGCFCSAKKRRPKK